MDKAIGVAREAGRITLKEGEPVDSSEYSVPYALVIEFANPESLRKAIQDGRCHFGSWTPAAGGQ